MRLTLGKDAALMVTFGTDDIDDDPARIDVADVWRCLSTDAYWGRWRTRDDVQRQINGAWHIVGCRDENGRTVGFARAVSDGVALAYLADVYIRAEHRGLGLGAALLRHMIDDCPGSDFRWMLHTADAHDLYRKLDFDAPTRRTWNARLADPDRLADHPGPRPDEQRAGSRRRRGRMAPRHRTAPPDGLYGHDDSRDAPHLRRRQLTFLLRQWLNNDERVNITVRPATAQRWEDVVQVFAGRGGSTCWCQRFRRPGGTDKPSALRDEIEHNDAPVGLIAYAGDEPAGWSRVVRRTSLPGIADNQALQRLYAHDEADPAWWISCFAVRRAYRGGGAGVALLREATRFARRHGAAVLDGHPVDVERLTRRPSPAGVFTGTMSMFTAAGFREIGRTYPSRPVMRHDLGGAG